MSEGTVEIPERIRRANHAISPQEFVRRGAVFLLLIALIIIFSFAQPAFISINNLMSILQAVSVVAIIGAGVTVTLAIGGFDLSVGAVAASVSWPPAMP